jgi:hypothetical protein
LGLGLYYRQPALAPSSRTRLQNMRRCSIRLSRPTLSASTRLSVWAPLPPSSTPCLPLSFQAAPRQCCQSDLLATQRHAPGPHAQLFSLRRRQFVDRAVNHATIHIPIPSLYSDETGKIARPVAEWSTDPTGVACSGRGRPFGSRRDGCGVLVGIGQ